MHRDLVLPQPPGDHHHDVLCGDRLSTSRIMGGDFLWHQIREKTSTTPIVQSKYAMHLSSPAQRCVVAAGRLAWLTPDAGDAGAYCSAAGGTLYFSMTFFQPDGTAGS